MVNNDTLRAGMVVRSGGEEYRVDYVNACRAFLIPMKKQHVVLPDGRTFEAERPGISVSPRAGVEIVREGV